MIWLFLVVLRRAQEAEAGRRESMRREILELQLKSVRNQLDPHFTFNALNSLAALSCTGDQEGVNRFISHFSRLLRNYLDNSDKILVRLTDELEFLDNYIELQRIRFDNQVSLDLAVNDDVDLERMIPKMLIQTHVENAVKHGRRGTGAQGHRGTGEAGLKILVEVRETEEGLSIVVQDNGVGRGHSGANRYESTGKGLKALERILESVRKLYGLDFRQQITDLVDEQGNAKGTRVEVRGA
ncbi:MAG: histidine kinase [Bacteroidales bacterium]